MCGSLNPTQPSSVYPHSTDASSTGKKFEAGSVHTYFSTFVNPVYNPKQCSSRMHTTTVQTLPRSGTPGVLKEEKPRVSEEREGRKYDVQKKRVSCLLAGDWLQKNAIQYKDSAKASSAPSGLHTRHALTKTRKATCVTSVQKCLNIFQANVKTGRIFNVSGQLVDNLGDGVGEDTLPIHRPARSEFDSVPPPPLYFGGISTQTCIHTHRAV